jgi:ADP-heptose:LPS heptosyltransferase
MYTPALRELRARYPDARIDLQVGNDTGCEEVLDGSGLFDNIYNLRYSDGLVAWVKRAREISETRYDMIINEFHSHSWRLALLVAASGSPWRVGHVTSPGWSHRFSRFSFIFNIPVAMREDEHESTGISIWSPQPGRRGHLKIRRDPSSILPRPIANMRTVSSSHRACKMLT